MQTAVQAATGGTEEDTSDMQLKDVPRQITRLRENDAFGLLLHPAVMRNYLLYAKETRERPTVMRSHPSGIEIELTSRCNLACTQCLRSLGLKPYKVGEMDPANYRRILAQFPYATNIVLSGFGEPMMYNRFFDIVAYTRKARPWAKIVIYSNGMRIDDSKARRLMDCGLTELNISIDAATPETYRSVRRHGDLEVLHENIRRLVRVRRETKARFPLLGLNYVMVNENEGELVRFVEQAHELGVDFINCISWASYDWGFKNQRSKESYLAELEAGRRRIEELGIRCKSFPSLDTSWTDPTKEFACSFFWGSSFRVTYSGEVALGCCSPFKETYTYGNLLEQPFGEVWNNEKFRRNREMARQGIPPNDVCQSCFDYDIHFFADQPVP